MAPRDGESKSGFLKRQLEQMRFERALEVTESMALHKVLMTTSELTRLNNILTGTEEDPWRQEPVSLRLRNGKTKNLSLIANPKQAAREKLHRATEFSEKGTPLEGAIQLYISLVLVHVFKDANRRTAALAAHYFFKRYRIPLSGFALHEIAVGDLREEEQTKNLWENIQQILMFVTKKH
jgi:prophage maintenance system killer protein